MTSICEKKKFGRSAAYSYRMFRPLNQEQLLSRAKSRFWREELKLNICFVFCRVVLKISLFLLSYHLLLCVKFLAGSFNIMKTKAW